MAVANINQKDLNSQMTVFAVYSLYLITLLYFGMHTKNGELIRHISVQIISTNSISTTAISAANILKALNAHIPHGLNILNFEKLYM